MSGFEASSRNRKRRRDEWSPVDVVLLGLAGLVFLGYVVGTTSAAHRGTGPGFGSLVAVASGKLSR